MKTLVLATLYICSIAYPNQCDQKQLQVESRACKLGQFEAKTPGNGDWYDVTIHLKCQ